MSQSIIDCAVQERECRAGKDMGWQVAHEEGRVLGGAGLDMANPGGPWILRSPIECARCPLYKLTMGPTTQHAHRARTPAPTSALLVGGCPCCRRQQFPAPA